MDKRSHHQLKSSKKTKTTKKPIKVVYISNPIEVKTSASEFRALVQELTGQGSSPTELTKFYEIQSAGGLLTVPGMDTSEPNSPNVPDSIVSPSPDQDSLPTSPIDPFELFGDVFSQQTVESFADLLPCSLFSEPFLGGCSLKP